MFTTLGRRSTARILEKLLDLPKPQVANIQVRRNIRVPMPDGVTLSTDLFRPPGNEPLPAVIVRTPYGKNLLPNDWWSILLARQGFQVIVQDTRGRFLSGGSFDAYRQERADGLATAAWVREQPWCNGTLATAGPSYLGHTQWSVAPYLDEPLAAMCPAITTSNFAEVLYPGGTLSLHIMFIWAMLVGAVSDGLEGSRFRDLLRASLVRDLRKVVQESRRAEAMAQLPLAAADNAAVGKPVPVWRTFTDHAELDDGYWAEINNTTALATLTTPVSMIAGWWDLMLSGQLRDYEILQASGCTRRITIGAWHHFGALPATITDSVYWLAAHLHGDTSVIDRPAVRLYLQNAGQWLDFDHWPPRQSTPTPIYLEASTLDWNAPENETIRTFTYDPTDPTPSTGGALLDPRAAGQRDNAATESRSDVLIFTSKPLEHNLDLIGAVSASIVVSTSTGFGDLFVRLCDVDPNGVSRNVSDGIVRLRGQQEPGSVTVEMQPTGYRFRRGHSLRIQVSGGAFPHYSRNNGTGEPLSIATETSPVTYRIMPGSSVTLPVMPTAAP